MTAVSRDNLLYHTEQQNKNRFNMIQVYSFCSVFELDAMAKKLNLKKK